MLLRTLFQHLKYFLAKSDMFWFQHHVHAYSYPTLFSFFSWSAFFLLRGSQCKGMYGGGCLWDGGGRCQRCLCLLHWASHPVALCPDAGQRRHRRSGPHRGRGSWGGAQQGVPCRSTSSTGQYRSAWAPPPPLPSLIIPSMQTIKEQIHSHTVKHCLVFLTFSHPG